MKRILMFLILLPFLAFAQDQPDTAQNRIVVTEDVSECVQKIHDNPDAIKLLMSTIMSDRNKMQQLHSELMKDESFKQMMRDMRNEMKDGHMENQMHQDMNQDEDPNQAPDMNQPPDTPVPDEQNPDMNQNPDNENPDVNPEIEDTESNQEPD